MQPFLSADDVLACPGDVVLADVRWYLDGRSGREAYETGHLPGAVCVDLDTDLAAPGTAAQGRHPLPAPQTFAAAMTRLGIGSDSTVIGYDDAGGVIAARLVWMLRAVGVRAALLDGGINAWSGAWESGPGEPRPPAPFEPRAWPAELVVGIEELADVVDPAGPGLLLDARPPERYRGEDLGPDPRAGHIPGAVNLPCRESVTEDGLLLDPAVLRERFRQKGVHPGAEVVSSCGSGVTACHTLLVLEQVGLPPGRLYPGSWSQYAGTDHPVVTGPQPRG